MTAPCDFSTRYNSEEQQCGGVDNTVPPPHTPVTGMDTASTQPLSAAEREALRTRLATSAR